MTAITVTAARVALLPPCPRCGVRPRSLLQDCHTPACVAAANDTDLTYERAMEDQS
jgi:hypothetical protein